LSTYDCPASLVFLKNNQLLGVTSDKDKKVQVFNLTLGEKVETGNVSDPLFTAFGYLQDLVAIAPNRELLAAFSPDRKLIAKSERGFLLDEGSVDLYEISTGKLLRTIKGHKGLVESIAFSPDGKRLATGSGDSTVLVWDLTSRP
jgi:WD40 repeat protein